MKKLLSNLAKLGISAFIVVFLLYRASKDGAFTELMACSKNWSLLIAATGVCLVSVAMLNVRWYLLVRALGLPMTLRDAFRIGFVGYLFNLAPMGVVGGDLIRSLMLIHLAGGHRTKAVTSVLVDRVVGLYLLFAVAAAAAFLSGFWRHDQQILLASVGAAVITLGGVAGLVFVLAFPGLISRYVEPQLARVPKVGTYAIRLIHALRCYRQQPVLLAMALSLSIVMHVVTVFCVHLLACGLYSRTPSFPDQLVLVPLSIATQVIPLPMGPLEAGLEYLYRCVGMPAHEGLIVALAFRLLNILAAVVGIIYYFVSKREVREALEEAGNESLDQLAENGE